jgi:hypothetical protein
MQAPQALGNLLSAAFDTLRGRTVVFGGSINGTASNQTWSYFGTGAPLASIAPYGAGCAGPTGVPALSVVSAEEKALLEKAKTMAEPAGASPLAAALRLREQLVGRRVALVLSGGNISPAELQQSLQVAVPAGL